MSTVPVPWLKPSAKERQALIESDSLLRFAAEKVSNLDPSLSLAIAKSRAAAESDKWTPETSREFWTAFAKLCYLIQPVTVDCLSVSDQNVESPKWRFWQPKRKISLAERSSARYLVLLFLLLAITIPLQLYVWTCTNLSKEITDIYNSNHAIVNKNAETVRNFRAITDPALNHPYTQEDDRVMEQLRSDREEILSNLELARSETRLLQLIATLHTSINLNTASLPDETNWYDDYHHALDRQNAQQAISLTTQVEVNLVVGIFLSFIMPVLFGTIGAVAFVIRSISDQIKSSTFSQNSPVRHLLRVGLGGLAGAVVGLFNNLSPQLSLSPLAIAFLAGYGVEGLFSMFDAFIAKFRT
jgi:hypothetical protein